MGTLYIINGKILLRERANARKGRNYMSKKSKGILKFIIACGVVISAVAAVFAVLYRMHNKLKAVDESENDTDDGVCDGSCEGCTLCEDPAEEDAESDEADEADTEEADV